MHDVASELEVLLINSGTSSVDPVFNFWTSSRHAVLCSPSVEFSLFVVSNLHGYHTLVQFVINLM